MSRRSLAGLALFALVFAATVAIVLGARDDDPRAARPRVTTPSPPAARVTPSALAGAIATAGLAEHLDALQRIAARNRGNRAAGTAGDRESVDYVAARLGAAGWRVQRQAVEFPYFRESRAPRVGGVSARDVRTLTYSGSGTVTGALRPVRLAPGTESASGCAPDDFGGLRRGEIALVQRGTCTFERKARNAQAAGAAAVLVANDGRPGRSAPAAGSLRAPGLRIPALALSARGGAALAALAGTPASVTVDAESEVRTTHNVIGELGAAGAQRVVMAGAHLDSVAAGPGLNDNGSGVSALLEVAEEIAGSEPPAGTRIRLGFWGAEELGLIGSRRYVDSLGAAGRREIAAYLNLDMVGSPDPRRAVYDGAAVRGGARAASVRIEAVLRRRLGGRIVDQRLGGSSDHASFARAGIPVGGLFTGVDRCYHRACDTRANVDTTILRTMARAAGASIVELAAAER